MSYIDGVTVSGDETGQKNKSIKYYFVHPNDSRLRNLPSLLRTQCRVVFCVFIKSNEDECECDGKLGISLALIKTLPAQSLRSPIMSTFIDIIGATKSLAKYNMHRIGLRNC